MNKNRICIRLLCSALAALIAVSCCIPAFASADDVGYVRTVFNKENGLPTDEANSVIQTSDGYLWVGSYGGLLRYDGTNFRNFSAEGAIATPSIRVLFQDTNGRLWIGSSDAGVFVYENGTFKAVECTEKTGFLSIRDFAEDNNGKIYVASTSGVCEIRDDVMVPIEDPNVKGETVYSLGIDSYNRLWCAMNAGNCAVLQNGSCMAMLEASAFFEGNKRIVCLTADREHNIYLGTNSTVLAKVTCNGAALDGSDFSVTAFTADDAEFHNRICVTDKGEMLVSGEQGFAYLKPKGERVDSHSPSRTDSVNWATVDYEGNVWLASSNEGLVRYTQGYFATPNYEQGGVKLAGTSVNAITASGGIYYAATDTGLLAFDAEWNSVYNTLTERLNGIHIKHIMADSKGRIWCGTYSDLGLVRYNPADNEIMIFNKDNGMESIRVRVSYETADGTVAVGTQDGLALINDNKVIAFYDKDFGMETQSILCIAQAPDGTLLAGSAGSGIYAVRHNGELKKYSYNEGLEDGVVLRIVPTDDGKSSFVSAGSHLYYWSENTFRRFDNLEIGAGSIFDICERNGRLWLMQDSGIYSVDRSQLLSGKSAHAAKYGTSDGLTGSISVNTWSYIAPDGRLYLATRNGISIFDFRSIDYTMPQIAINSIVVDDATYEQPKKVTLKKNNRRMTVNFSALTFSGTADLCLAYQLVGFAKQETVLFGTSGSVSYTNLDGGTYTFRLRVFDPDDPEIQKTVYVTVVKEKSLIEYPAVWVVGILLLGLLFFAVAHLLIHKKIKSMQQRQQMYRSVVEQALRTVAKTIDAKDSYTNGHSVRVAIYAREITKRLGYSKDDQETVYYIALMHDIGKIAIPDNILNKKGELTPEERSIVHIHPIKGAEILRDFTLLKGLTDGALYHHERYDGKGYCAGLAGEDIPLIGRIVCVADCYDAMSSERCYRKAMTSEEIINEFEKCSGTQFDPKIAAVMIDMIREGVVPVSVSKAENSSADIGAGLNNNKKL